MSLRDYKAQLRAAVAEQSAQDKVRHAMGAAGKTVAGDAAVRTLGADAVMSGVKRRSPKAKLGAGYDLGDGGAVVLKLRPGGLWALAQGGRRAGKRIYPKRAQALRTPYGPKASVMLGRSRGLGTLDAVHAALEPAVAVAAGRQVAANIRASGLG